jgi:hypothetical protein
MGFKFGGRRRRDEANRVSLGRVDGHSMRRESDPWPSPCRSRPDGCRLGPSRSREATSRRLTSKNPDFDRRGTGARARLAPIPAWSGSFKARRRSPRRPGIESATAPSGRRKRTGPRSPSRHDPPGRAGDRRDPGRRRLPTPRPGEVGRRPRSTGRAPRQPRTVALGVNRLCPGPPPRLRVPGAGPRVPARRRPGVPPPAPRVVPECGRRVVVEPTGQAEVEHAQHYAPRPGGVDDLPGPRRVVLEAAVGADHDHPLLVERPRHGLGPGPAEQHLAGVEDPLGAVHLQAGGQARLEPVGSQAAGVPVASSRAGAAGRRPPVAPTRAPIPRLAGVQMPLSQSLTRTMSQVGNRASIASSRRTSTTRGGGREARRRPGGPGGVRPRRRRDVAALAGRGPPRVGHHRLVTHAGPAEQAAEATAGPVGADDARQGDVGPQGGQGEGHVGRATDPLLAGPARRSGTGASWLSRSASPETD